MKIVQILIKKKVPPVNSEVLVDLRNIENTDHGNNMDESEFSWKSWKLRPGILGDAKGPLVGPGQSPGRGPEGKATGKIWDLRFTRPSRDENIDLVFGNKSPHVHLKFHDFPGCWIL